MKDITPHEKCIDKNQQISDSNVQTTELNHEIGEGNKQVSNNWHITAPMRKLYHRIRRNRYIRFLAKGVKYLLENGIRATWQRTKEIGGIRSILRRILRKENPVPARVLLNADNISFAGMVNCASSNGATVFLPDKIADYALENKRKVLLVSHELDLTGAPIVLLNYANSLIRNGDLPIIVSPNPGKLSNSVVENGIPVIVFDGIYSTEFVQKFAPLFDIVIVNTIIGSPVVNMLAYTNTPVLWWIHEAADIYNEHILASVPTVQPSNVSIYCVGAYAEKVLLGHRPSFQTKQLLYHTVDMECSTLAKSPIKKDDRLLFVMVGTMQNRKGPDILADAILSLSEDTIAQSRFLFIGRPVDELIIQKVETACKSYPNHVAYLEEMPHDQLLALYQDVDCLIAPSRDDPMPCTITEVLLLSVPVICSESCGYAPLLAETSCGAVFADNDPQKLAVEITNIVNNRQQLKKMSTQARHTYEMFFSESVFDRNSQKAIADTIANSIDNRKKRVSVVIPTYNAGDEGLRLFQLLQKQEGLDALEIIIVDSGSKDNTVEIARNYCSNVIQIPNESFSHSYARNLGAQYATGNYILFMTQDAVPSSSDWIHKMVTSIQEHGAVAASCREIPKSDCDLYGILCGYIHNQYMEIADHDRILRKPSLWTAETIRKNAQLNDVACMIQKNVILSYKFRGNYAEDLDLGLRLMADNYRLMLLSSAPVIHSHTRSAMYHFRRAVVDVKALKRIIPELPVGATSAAEAYNRILTCAFMTFHSANAIQKLFLEAVSPRTLCTTLNSVFSKAGSAAAKITKKAVMESVAHGIPFDDGGMLKLMEEITAVSPDITFDPSGFNDVKSFMLNEVIDYFEHIGKTITPDDIPDVVDTMLKRMGSILGSILASYSMTEGTIDPSLDDLIQKYSQGI